MSNKLTGLQIQEINRQIAAGKYQHIEDEPEPKPRKKTTAKRFKPEPIEKLDDKDDE